MSRTVNLEIETDELTSGGLAEIAKAILECLLYQRNQIDMVYSHFRSIVNGWLADETDSQNSDSLHGYMLQRQREKAIETKNSVSAMGKLIAEAFNKNDVKSLRFLFGATMSTPKEVYTIHLPINSAACLHLSDHHRLHKTHLNRLLISLVNHEGLNDVFSKIICPTNIFMELEMLQTVKDATLENIIPTVEKTMLPKSCKDIHFRVLHKKPAGIQNVATNCCRLLGVYNGVECVESVNRTDHVYEDDLMSGASSTWWESEIIIRGFKEKLVKGRSIWNK